MFNGCSAFIRLIFSYVILEIGGIYQRDAGLYTCKAVNKHGEATVSCTLTIKVGRHGRSLQLDNNVGD